MIELFWDSAWKVAIWSVVLGAGLPALFALGVRTTVLANAGGPGVTAGGESAPAAPRTAACTGSWVSSVSS